MSNYERYQFNELCIPQTFIFTKFRLSIPQTFNFSEFRAWIPQICKQKMPRYSVAFL